MKNQKTITENLASLYEECRRAKGGDMHAVFEQAYELFRQMKEEGIRVHRTHTICAADRVDMAGFVENHDGTITSSSWIIESAGMRNRESETFAYSPYLHLRFDDMDGSRSGMITFSPARGMKTFQTAWNSDYMADLKTLVCRPECKAQARLDDLQSVKDLYLILCVVNECFTNKAFVESREANIKDSIENWEIRRKTF